MNSTKPAGPNGSELSERLGPAVTLPLHPEHGWTWTEREREFLERWAAEQVAAERERWRARMLERMREYDHLADAAATETGARLFRAKAGALAEVIDGPNVASNRIDPACRGNSG